MSKTSKCFDVIGVSNEFRRKFYLRM